MAKIGRNRPCPCGSGKKYKRCCLVTPTVAPDDAVIATAANDDSHDELCPCCVDELNDRADRVADAIAVGHLDEAEAQCHALLRDFPRPPEVLDLLSMIFEARGHRDRALELAREASEIVETTPAYGTDMRTLMRVRVRQLELRA